MAIAADRRRGTVTAMTKLTESDRVCVEYLHAIVRAEISGAPILVASMLTLTQPFELLHPHTHVADGALHVPAISFNNVSSSARSVPLSHTAAAILCARRDEGSVRELLCIPPGNLGPLLHHLRSQLLELELPDPLELEELWVPVMHALVCRAADPLGRHSVLAYAGMPPQGAKAQRLRSSVDLSTVAVAIDALCADAGLGTASPSRTQVPTG